MTTQIDDIKKEIQTLEVMKSHAAIMGDNKRVKECQDKIYWLQSAINNMQ
jgi:predicted CoA-binding protein